MNKRQTKKMLKRVANGAVAGVYMKYLGRTEAGIQALNFSKRKKTKKKRVKKRCFTDIETMKSLVAQKLNTKMEREYVLDHPKYKGVRATVSGMEADMITINDILAKAYQDGEDDQIHEVKQLIRNGYYVFGRAYSARAREAVESNIPA